MMAGIIILGFVSGITSAWAHYGWEQMKRRAAALIEESLFNKWSNQ
jgi:hypothetical protein